MPVRPRSFADFDAADVAESEHFEFYWFPHTERVPDQAQQPQRRARPAAPARSRRWLDDEFLSNTALRRGVPGRPRRPPPPIPRMAPISGRALSARTSTRLRTRSSPPAAGALRGDGVRRARARPSVEALREGADDGRADRGCEDQLPGRGARRRPADDITAVHRVRPRHRLHRRARVPGHALPGLLHRRVEAHHDPATAVRPHWGKVHTRDAAYPPGASTRGSASSWRCGTGLIRSRLFANDYLRRVLGP